MRKDETRLAGSRKQKIKRLEGHSLYAEKKSNKTGKSRIS